MPTFDRLRNYAFTKLIRYAGGDEWICQCCGKVFDSTVKSEWRPDITGHTSAGNVCPACLKKHEK